MGIIAAIFPRSEMSALDNWARLMQIPPSLSEALCFAFSETNQSTAKGNCFAFDDFAARSSEKENELICGMWCFLTNRFIGFIFQNTYTNAAKLLEAARHLAKGECDPEEIQKRVDHFEKRVQEFISRVNRRKALLQLAVNFYSRTQKVR